MNPLSSKSRHGAWYLQARVQDAIVVIINKAWGIYIQGGIILHVAELMNPTPKEIFTELQTMSHTGLMGEAIDQNFGEQTKAMRPRPGHQGIHWRRPRTCSALLWFFLLFEWHIKKIQKSVIIDLKVQMPFARKQDLKVFFCHVVK